MRAGICKANSCSVEHKPWAGSSVGDFLKDNPGWRWVPSNDGSSLVLCPEHAQEAVLLTNMMMALLGKYAVPPGLRKAAGEIEGTPVVLTEDQADKITELLVSASCQWYDDHPGPHGYVCGDCGERSTDGSSSPEHSDDCDIQPMLKVLQGV